MAGEISCDAATGITIYANIRNRTSGFIFNVSSGQFETYSTASGNQNAYQITLSEQGTGGHYLGNVPSTLGPGTFDITAKRRINAWFAETDQLVANGQLEWNTSVAVPLSDLSTSGQLANLSPLRLARGTMIQNFPLFFRSSSDHLTGMTSGVVSGQIARDNGSFGVLQSGSFTETGLGWFNLSALTSGDLLCNTVKLHFSCVGISGGSADNIDMSFVLQRTSGQ